MTLQLRSVVVALLAGLTLLGNASAQTYPSRPITMIVPFPAGGPTDTIARIMGDHMKDTLGQTLIVENVTGAGSTIGTGRAVQAPPDGYTIYVGNWTSAVGRRRALPTSWHILNDLTPIAQLPASSLMIVGKTGLPANNIKELIAWLKANPDKATAAQRRRRQRCAHLRLYFMDKTGTSFQFAQYRGGAPAMQDLVGDQIDLMCAEASQTLTHVRGGKMKAFAVMSAGRWAPLPDVPTMQEVGCWTCCVVLARAVGSEGHAQAGGRHAQHGGQQGTRRSGGGEADRGPGHDHPAPSSTPQALAKYHKAEVDKWWPIIKAANIKMN